jgi:hypothetical protein
MIDRYLFTPKWWSLMAKDWLTSFPEGTRLLQDEVGRNREHMFFGKSKNGSR